MAKKKATATASAVARKHAPGISPLNPQQPPAPTPPDRSPSLAKTVLSSAGELCRQEELAVGRGLKWNYAEEESGDPHDAAVLLMSALRHNERFNELCVGLMEHYPPSPSVVTVETASDSPHFHLRLFAARLFRAGQLAENPNLFLSGQSVSCEECGTQSM